MVCIFYYTLRQLWYLSYLRADVIFLRRDIYEFKSAMRKYVFSYSKTVPVPVRLDSKNYTSTFYLVILGEDFDRKYGEQKNA